MHAAETINNGDADNNEKEKNHNSLLSAAVYNNINNKVCMYVCAKEIQRCTQYRYIVCVEGWIKDVCSVHACELARKVELYIIIILYVYFREISPARGWRVIGCLVWGASERRRRTVFIFSARSSILYNIILCSVRDSARTPNPRTHVFANHLK